MGVAIGLLAGYLGGLRAGVVAATPTELAVVNPPEPAHQRGV